MVFIITTLTRYLKGTLFFMVPLLFVLNAAYAQQSPQPKVLDIHPKTNKIPENLLRFYIRFNTPMQEGHSLDFITLTDASGKTLNGVFFDPEHELWSKDRRVLTVLVDPGRVKSGLKANQQLGRAFTPGKEFKLTVKSGWPALSGASLQTAYNKNFVGIKADTTSPQETQVTVSKDAESITVTFPEPMDYFQLYEYVALKTPSGMHLRATTIDENGYWVQFEPTEKGEHSINIIPILEDISANNFNRTFETKAFETSRRPNAMIEKTIFW